MSKVKNIALENEGMKDRIAFLENVIDQQREYIAEVEAENSALMHNVDIKRKIIAGLKLNNSSLTVERNNLIKELEGIKSMTMLEFANRYCTSEQHAEAGRQFARELLGR